MKKVRAYIVVDLNVADNLTNKQIVSLIGVGKYQQNEVSFADDIILLKDNDFEVLDYVDVEIIDHKYIPHIKE
jgi:hypothetical protein